MQPGTPEHKELFCNSFLDSHEPYEPEALSWPDLDGQALATLRSLPIWSSALQAETNAGLMVARFAETQRDPLIRKALEVQAYEESRHARLLTGFVRRYGLEASVRDEDVRATRQAFIDFGCRECLHAFLGFGAYRLALHGRVVPEALMPPFTRLMGEEARHIVFFVNWLAYEQAAGHGWAGVPVAPSVLGYARVVAGIVREGAGVRAEAEALPVTGSALAGLTPARFLQTCLAENARQMARFDPRLARPRFLPATAQLALRAIEVLGRAQEVSRVLVGARPQVAPAPVPRSGSRTG